MKFLAPLFAAAVAASAVSTALAAEAPKIATIRAQLYFEGSGKFSDDVLESGEPTLWNTIIGEGGAGAPSNFTLVTVEVQGKDVAVARSKCRSARGYKRKIVGQRTIDVSLYDEKTKFFAPLWLYDTGCDEIEISRGDRQGVAARTVKDDPVQVREDSDGILPALAINRSKSRQGSLVQKRCQTASSLPLGSVKWKRRPPGKAKIGFVILPPAAVTDLSAASRSLVSTMASGAFGASALSACRPRSTSPVVVPA
jgi:hypothetical protein